MRLLYLLLLINIGIISEAVKTDGSKISLNNKVFPLRVKRVLNESLLLPEDYSKYGLPRLNYQILNDTWQDYQYGSVALNQIICRVSLNFSSVQAFDEDNQLITFDLTMTLSWRDYLIENHFQNLNSTQKDEIGYDPIIMSPEFVDRLWLPDPYIENAVKFLKPTLLSNTETLKITVATGDITYTLRRLVQMTCALDFVLYPLDTQKCDFQIRSYSHPTKSLVFTLNGVYLKEISDPNFEYDIQSVTESGNELELLSQPWDSFSRLTVTFWARRRISYHLVQTYFMSMFFVIVTWPCFLVSPDMYEARVGITMTSLLTLTAMFGSLRGNTPKVNYIKAIDWWMVVSILFIFAAFGGFTIPTCIKQRLRMLNTKNRQDMVLDKIMDKNWHEIVAHDFEDQRTIAMYRSGVKLVENYGVFILALMYISFVVIYWYFLLYRSDYTVWCLNETFNFVSDEFSNYKC